VEASGHLHRTVELIKSFGARAGVSLNPATSLKQIEEIVHYIDLLLIMSVNPGFGGQQFIGTSLAKIAKARKILDELPHQPLLEPALLLLYYKKPSHAYALVNSLDTLGMEAYPADISAIYRILYDLEARGMITSSVEAEGSAGPPRASTP